MKYESEMYGYIKDYFISLGYDVKAEVNSIDLMAVKGDHIIAVEMKLTFNEKLIFQAIERQRACSDVYIAFLASRTSLAKIENIINLAKRLHLGLLLLHERESGVHIEVLCVPKYRIYRENLKMQEKNLREFNSRLVDLNIGGVRSTKIASAYLEKSISIAAYLRQTGESGAKVSDIVKNTGISEAGRILRSNYSEMYVNISRGVYGFNFQNENSELSYKKYLELCDYYENKYSNLEECDT